MSNPQVELHIEELGVITLELDADKAPKSTENFLAYVNKGHYDRTVFHRVIPGFMVQGGGFEPGMSQKSVEAPINNEANNGLKNHKYTVAMARTAWSCMRFRYQSPMPEADAVNSRGAVDVFVCSFFCSSKDFSMSLCFLPGFFSDFSWIFPVFLFRGSFNQFLRWIFNAFTRGSFDYFFR
jgi:hypothetical protein